MNPEPIKYRKGYKYSLWETAVIPTKVIGYNVRHHLFELSADGELTVHQDYPWDGPSGLTFDTPSSMRGALAHDALYEAMRLGLLPQECFHAANETLRWLCLADGMWTFRANLWFDAVERFGSAFAAYQPEQILTAPKDEIGVKTFQ